jgi:hypothetical protein
MSNRDIQNITAHQLLPPMHNATPVSAPWQPWLTHPSQAPWAIYQASGRDF